MAIDKRRVGGKRTSRWSESARLQSENDVRRQRAPREEPKPSERRPSGDGKKRGNRERLLRAGIFINELERTQERQEDGASIPTV